MKSKPDDGRDTLAAHIDAEADPLMNDTQKKRSAVAQEAKGGEGTPPVVSTVSSAEHPEVSTVSTPSISNSVPRLS